MKVEHMHMGNSGKSKKLMENSDPKLNSKWEFIAYHTPHQNGLIGAELATIDGHAMTMCNTTKMSVMTWNLVMNEVLTYSRAPGNLVMDKSGTRTHYQLIGLQNPKWVEPGIVWTFRKMGIMKCGKNGKLGDWGMPKVFVGYVKNHPSNCYRMWNAASIKVTESCDVIWLHCLYYQNGITADMTMLTEVSMSVHEIPKDTIASMQLEGSFKWEPGCVDPAHVEMDFESVMTIYLS